ncbi:MAG: hemolysin III family protein [Propionibacteriaceae bacterium]|jgi:hemolysin III|nr:hemolysin III family protein [Propionibacteriaceae bacterium]
MTTTDKAPRLGAAGEIKPHLRGWLHAGTVPLLGAGIIVLICLAHGTGPKWSLAVYLACAIILFGVSATYHIGTWSTPVRDTFRRLDHANIFVFIAGTYTPLSVILLTGVDRIAVLALIWGCAVAGVLTAVFWLSAPRWVQAIFYVVMGWAAVWWMPQFARAGGIAVIILVIVGGVVYSLGAVIYAMKRPNFSKTWYGFHELFHTFTIIAAFCHYAAITIAVMKTR